ncbi:hypothetical protein EV424DRAFT_1343341 [Suillus variegatus]|nr:hypothetical protein EV424DRAFT_1343341 [Suillus variegatus]
MLSGGNIMPTVMNRQTLGEDGSNFDAADAARVAWMKESRDHQAFLITGHTGQEQAICSMPRGNSAPSKARTMKCKPVLLIETFAHPEHDNPTISIIGHNSYCLVAQKTPRYTGVSTSPHLSQGFSGFERLIYADHQHVSSHIPLRSRHHAGEAVDIQIYTASLLVSLFPKHLLAATLAHQALDHKARDEARDLICPTTTTGSSCMDGVKAIDDEDEEVHHHERAKFMEDGKAFRQWTSECLAPLPSWFLFFKPCQELFEGWIGKTWIDFNLQVLQFPQLRDMKFITINDSGCSAFTCLHKLLNAAPYNTEMVNGEAEQHMIKRKFYGGLEERKFAMPNSFDSRPSDFNDGMEALLTGAVEPVDVCKESPLISQIRSYTPDSTQSHDYKNCPGQGGYGQALPVYPCGCYQYSKTKLGFHGASLEELEPPEAIQVAGASEAERCKRIEQEINDWNARVEGGSCEMLPPKRKRSTSDVGDVTSRQFGQNMTNVGRAVSAPVLEVSQKLKRRKLAKSFEFKGSTAHETLLKVGKDIEAAIDRQTEILSKLYDILESRAGQR